MSPGPVADVRLRGFDARASLEEAHAWIDAAAGRLPVEAVEPGGAVGRVLGAAPSAAAGAAARAGEDGFAVRAEDTVGAGAYSPLLLALQEPGAPLRPGAAALVVAGDPLPPGADAILSFQAAQPLGAGLEVLAPVASGTGVELRGEELRAAAALSFGRPLRPQDAALLAALGVSSVEVVRRPRVRVVVAGPKRAAGAAAPADACGLLLRTLAARDGAEVEVVPAAEGRRGLAAALAAPGDPDAVLLAGRTGTGPDDEGPRALAEVGELALHGVAVRPGGSAGLGLAGRAPAVLLPGHPLACLFAYELIAGRLVRRLGGRDPGLPHLVREAELRRKIISAVGFVDACSVRLVDGGAEPIGAVDRPGLAVAVRADGFVIVPAPLEGHPAGARVAVHLHAAGGRGEPAW